MIARKNGAPSSDVIAPTGSAEPFPMLREAAGKRVRRKEQDAPRQRGRRNRQPVILSEQALDRMRTDDPDKPDHAEERHAHGGDERREQHGKEPQQIDVDAEGLCGCVAAEKRVARPRSPNVQMTAADSPTSVA